MTNNAASNNSRCDMKLTGDLFRFGFPTPGSFGNVVAVGDQKSLVTKCCGLNNIVNSPSVNTTEDPRF